MPTSSKIIKTLKSFQKKIKSKTKAQSNKTLVIINFILLIILASSLTFNQIIISEINKSLGIKTDLIDKISTLTKIKSQNNNLELSGEIMADTIKLVISEGLPEIYGEELGISFNETQAAINVMKIYDPTYGQQKITLTGDDLGRYIEVGLKISCEYCCSAKSIIRDNGQAACVCAHSMAMRGLLAYLIQNHGTEYSNDELLRELARWKGVYFPKQIIQKMASQLQGSQEFTPDTAAMILDLKLPDYGGKGAPLPSEIKNLPSMVGGC